MLYQPDNSDYTLETTNNLQTIRPFPDPSFPFTVIHLNMAELSIPYIPWHWHDELECVWVKSGTLTVKTTDTTLVLLAGEGLFINHSVLHTMQTEPGQDCELYSMRFYSKLLFPDKSSSLASQYLHPLLMAASVRHIHLPDNAQIEGRMLQLIKQIVEIYYSNEGNSELRILSNLYALWAEINTYANQYPSSLILTQSVISDFNRVIDAIHYIANHYAESITLEDIAGSIHLSKSECCRCFKRTVSLSPIEFLIQYRIMEAIRKMQTNDVVASSISGLSAAVGFNSASYFNKQFKRYIKYTPLEYRKKLLSNNSETVFEKEFKDILTNSLEHE
ncbi:MAG: helix-turn-helix transcriptional regulator [Lachnospiraceae bacterium]|nr:helix-turn-helix transcriptional regulator [Lachnospiraceae bacterium]